MIVVGGPRAGAKGALSQQKTQGSLQKQTKRPQRLIYGPFRANGQGKKRGQTAPRVGYYQSNIFRKKNSASLYPQHIKLHRDRTPPTSKTGTVTVPMPGKKQSTLGEEVVDADRRGGQGAANWHLSEDAYLRYKSPPDHPNYQWLASGRHRS
ncbi:hypothetical protein CDAR_366621 [Caerostris darwini]|uniref:Uncharacterized protein n=1 Tax=Caerostris darwini TaxID=1538125 RepID=A0AAV4Q5T2_9ARAC|nr:hypothetical protein CDAR_366621 [Caerostris darwini]